MKERFYKAKIGEEDVFLKAHPTSGGEKGQCGVEAFRKAAKIEITAEQLYADLIEVLEERDHPAHKACVDCLGSDIAHLLLPSEANNVQLSAENTEKLKALAKKVELDDDPVSHELPEELQKACQTKEVCLDYIKSDIQKNNWVSVGVILAWGVIHKKNVRIWQIPESGSKDTVTLMEEKKSNPMSGNFLDILFIHANHFEFLTKEKPSAKFESDSKKKHSATFFKKASEKETKKFIENLKQVFDEKDNYKLHINEKTGKSVIEKDNRKCEVMVKKSPDTDKILTTVMAASTSDEDLNWLVECTKKLMDKEGKTELSIEHPDPKVKARLIEKCEAEHLTVMNKSKSSRKTVTK